MSDTPRTDACWDDESCNILIHARQLERELAEAQQHRDEWFELYTQTLKKLGDAREQIAKLITDS